VVRVICLGLAGGGIIPLLELIFGARYGAAFFGRVMSFVMLSGMFDALAPVIAGWIFDTTQFYNGALWGLVLRPVPAMLAMYWLPQAHRSE